MVVPNSALHALDRRADLDVDAAGFSELFVVQEPTGVDDPAQFCLWCETRHQCCHAVEVEQDSSAASADEDT